MANKKKTHQKKTIVKTMKREMRLQNGALWVRNYSGRHVIRDYKKAFGLDLSATLFDLYKLAVLSDATYKQMQNAEGKRLHAKKDKSKKPAVDIWDNSDDYFFFIAGYTSGGAAYGVTWEEVGLEAYETPTDMK